MKKEEEQKMSSIYRYPKLSKYEGLSGIIPIRAPTTYVGVEVELEKINLIHDIPSSFTMIEDGSLKLRGKEFVTVPIRFLYLEQELNRLFLSLKNPYISKRCSVHVHLNARDFTQQELYRFILLYLVFEEGLFNFSGGRQNNIFCTPLSSNLPEVASEVHKLTMARCITYMKWHKYSALNLCPLWGGEDGGSKRIGTVEFRHMAGNTNVGRIIEWINLIVSLKLAAKRFKTEELREHLLHTNTPSGFNWLATEVFKTWHPYLSDQHTFKQDCEAGVLNAKLVAFHQEASDGEIKIPVILRKE